LILGLARNLLKLTQDTFSLKVILPAEINTNKELLIKGKPLIGIIGGKGTDVYDASLERHRESGTDLVP
jgi:hypothetical protein